MITIQDEVKNINSDEDDFVFDIKDESENKSQTPKEESEQEREFQKFTKKISQAS